MTKINRGVFITIAIITVVMIILCGVLLTNVSTANADELYSDNTTARPDNLKEITKNTRRNTTEPSMTILTHGLGGDERAWSNNGPNFAYDENSLIETLAGDRLNTKVILAKMVKDTESNLLNFKLFELPEGDYSKQMEIETLSQGDMSKHLIVIFADSDNMQGNDSAYEELDFLIDSLFYDLQVLGVDEPRMNLVGHSRGGILNMMYAIEHPYNVAGLFSIGTPYNGSTTYDLGKELLSLSIFADNPLKEMLGETINSAGGIDITDKDRIKKNKEDWNAMINSSGINAYAIGGAMSEPFINELMNFVEGLLDLAGDLKQVGDIDKLEEILKKHNDYARLFIGDANIVEMLKFVQSKINCADSIYGIVKNIHDDITSGNSVLLKHFTLSDEVIEHIKDGKTELENYSKYYYNLQEAGATDEAIDNAFRTQINETILRDYTIGEIYNKKLGHICSRIDIGGLFEKFGFKINEVLPSGVKAQYLFGSDGIDYKNLISGFINFELEKQYLESIKSIISNILDTFPSVNAVIQPLITSNPVVKKLTNALIHVLATIDIIDEDEFKKAVSDLIEPYASILSEFKMKNHTRFIDNIEYFFKFWKDEAVWLNDGFVDLNSQLAEGYNGFTKKAKLFDNDNADLFKVAQSGLPIPIVHNLETRDQEIINFISQNIDIGLADPYYFSYRKVSKEAIYITGIKPKYELESTISIPETFNGYKVVGIADNAFLSDRFANVNEVILPNTITYIGKKAFAHFKSLTKINLPESLTKIGEYAFADCKLENIELPIGLSEISTGMFFNSELSIESVPENITKIGEFAFYGCKMARFEIHKNLTEIGEGAFADCSNLNLYHKSTVEIYR